MEVFRLLVEHYRQDLYSYIYAVLRNPKDTEDALQEALLQIYLALPQYRGQGLKTWLTRIAVNKAIDYKRKLKRTIELPLEGTVGGPESQLGVNNNNAAAYEGTTEGAVLRAERVQQVHNMIEAMPEGHKKVVQAFYMEDKSYKEIAEQEQVELKTVESRLYRAKQWLRKHWKKEDLT
ncbi:RNA polymerase sigma factor [Paenibacillus pinihumi]|uniref:RNA polymerase sigma factor n=1 Tax=Paenibacillus pinihumi TaxID=669462 RepID=UPI00041707A3|nr:RNA polymerase sigma factor [Paenibacillus pinihumi]